MSTVADGGGFRSARVEELVAASMFEEGIISSSSLTPEDDCQRRWRWNRLKSFVVVDLPLVFGTGLVDPAVAGGGERGRGREWGRRQRQSERENMM